MAADKLTTKNANVIGKGKPGPGRKPGVPNKLNAAVKECILEAFHKVGGVEYLAQQARENPVAFMSLLGRIVPTDNTGAIKVTIGYEPPTIDEFNARHGVVAATGAAALPN